MNNFISPEEYKKNMKPFFKKRRRGRGRPAKVYGQRQKGWKERPLI